MRSENEVRGGGGGRSVSGVLRLHFSSTKQQYFLNQPNPGGVFKLKTWKSRRGLCGASGQFYFVFLRFRSLCGIYSTNIEYGA